MHKVSVPRCGVLRGEQKSLWHYARSLVGEFRSNVVPLPASSKCSSCYLAGQLAIFEFQLTIYENIFDALGKLRRLRISSRIFNGDRIEDGDICEIAFLE